MALSRSSKALSFNDLEPSLSTWAAAFVTARSLMLSRGTSRDSSHSNRCLARVGRIGRHARRPRRARRAAREPHGKSRAGSPRARGSCRRPSPVLRSLETSLSEADPRGFAPAVGDAARPRHAPQHSPVRRPDPAVLDRTRATRSPPAEIHQKSRAQRQPSARSLYHPRPVDLRALSARGRFALRTGSFQAHALPGTTNP